jgi:propanol-preferring alcohol dehydrogenase
MGGVQAVLVTVPLISAYEEAFKSVKPGGCVVAIALPNRKDKLSLSIVDFTVKGITFLSSLVGTRQDLQESLALAKLHNITCKVQKRKLEEINEIFDDMTNYKISGRVVLDFSSK